MMRLLNIFLVLLCFQLPLKASITNNLTTATDKKNYTIQLDNQLTIVYFYKDGRAKDVYERIPVLPNGKATIPKIGEVSVKNLTHKELCDLIQSNLDDNTSVEVVIYRVSNNITVIGAVNNPGSYSINDIKTVYDAIGKAGGFTITANKRDVKLIKQREDGTREEHVINFPKQVFKAYEQGSGVGADIYLVKEGDLVYVPNSFVKQSGIFTLRLLQVVTIGIMSGVISAAID